MKGGRQPINIRYFNHWVNSEKKNERPAEVGLSVGGEEVGNWKESRKGRFGIGNCYNSHLKHTTSADLAGICKFYIKP